VIVPYEETSGRFAGHRWGFDVYIDLFGPATTAAAEKLASEEKECRTRNDHKDYEYRHDCSATATTVIISHKQVPSS
jgi:hypothetical protein